MTFWDRVLKRMRERRLRYWEQRYIEARGRIADIELGPRGITWKSAVADRDSAERLIAYYRAKLGKPTA